MLSRMRGSLRELLVGNRSLAKLSIWMQEKMQDEFEAQDEIEQRKRAYSYPSQNLLRIAVSPVLGADSLLRPAHGEAKIEDKHLLRASGPEDREQPPAR